MNNVNKTLYIPLYAKAYVSQKKIILDDLKAQEIWQTVKFPLKGKAKSKWLAYYMGMRSAVIDHWVNDQLEKYPDATVLHLGCGLDSRCLRVKSNQCWYDVDFESVIEERKKYYEETQQYHMIASDLRNPSFLENIASTPTAIIILEGVSMYLSLEDLNQTLDAIKNKFDHVVCIMDVYSTFAAKASKYKNPINEVGVYEVYGIDDPHLIHLAFEEALNLTPQHYISQLPSFERLIFQNLYAGNFAKKLYQLYTFKG